MRNSETGFFGFYTETLSLSTETLPIPKLMSYFPFTLFLLVYFFRGLFTLSTYQPLSTETLPIPKLCLTGRASPRNTTVDLTHIDTPANMNHWPLFHNGVAASVRIDKHAKLDSTWILFNQCKVSEMSENEHAGFLMGLGLNGHLEYLANYNIHDYLTRVHEMISVGLILGMAAGK